MELRLTLLLCLLLLGAAAADAEDGRSRDVQSDPPTPEYTTCRFNQKELHTTVRSAAGSALTGVCNPAEMESRLLEMERRLSHRLEELKETFTRLLIDGVAYDYDEEGDSSEGIEQHPYTGGAGATATTDGDDDSGATEHGGYEAHSRIAAASTARRTTYSSAGEAASGAASSADADSDSAESRDSGAHGSSRRYSYKWSSSSRRSSADSSGDQGGAGRATGDAAASEDADSGQTGSQGTGSRGSSSRRYSYRWSSSSRGSSRDASGGQARDGGATSGAASSQNVGAEAEGSLRSGSSRSSSRRHSYERRTSSQGASRAASGEQAQVGRAIGAAASSADTGSQGSGSSRSSSRRYSYERTSSRGSSGAASGEQGYDGVADFGPGGPPEQTSWFPGTSRTTTGTGVPDLSGTPERTGGFGFGAVGVPLDEAEARSSQTSSGARVRAGGATYGTGGGSVLYRDSQTYGSSAEARRPGSFAGGATDQYAAVNTSRTTSGERQVSAYDVSQHSRRGGGEVRFLNSYTPTSGAGAYYAFRNQQGRASGSQSRHSNSRRKNRGRGWRRNQRVYDTVSSIAGSDSAPLSRYLEIDNYNDTVYELDGKRMYSYYWEVQDFPTMMATWEHRHSLRSPSFYVFQGGYRMYIRVFPSRQGGNVYLHTGLTPGRYDDQLSWPFALRLRLSLLDHSDLKYDIRSRIWDPRKLCSGWNWKRPRRKDNFECVGLGFPQSLLETQRFLLDGAVLIKLDVFLEE